MLRYVALRVSRRITVVAAACGALAAGALACAPAVLRAADTPPSGVAWVKDWKTAQKQARATGRPLLVDFWAEWCHWCHELDRTTYADPAVVALSAGFVGVKVNAEGSLAEVELARRYEVTTLPTIAFLSPQGRLVLRRTAFEDAEKFADTLRSAARAVASAAPFEAALARDGKDASALHGLGALLFDQRLPAEAEALLSKARRLDRSRPLEERKRTRALLADIARHLGRPDDAGKLRREAAALGELPER
jgi:thioredoxin-like negative regulator of GroEL